MRVSPALEALTPRDADTLAMSPTLLAQWLDAHGVEWHRSLMVFLFDRASEAQPAPVDDPRRADAAELRVFAERAARLPPRLQQVAQLCLEDGLSLRACAERLGLSRETVRVHLRRLRALRRMVMARNGERVTPRRGRGRCARRRARGAGGRSRTPAIEGSPVRLASGV